MTEKYEGFQLSITEPVQTEPTTEVILDIRRPKPPTPKLLGQKKELSVVESNPFQLPIQRRVMMLTEQERRDIKQSNPDWNVRLANKQEMLDNLCIPDNGEEEEEEDDKNNNKELTTEERLKRYRETMTFIEDRAEKMWVLNNRELLMMPMPNGRILRWDWGETNMEGGEG